MGTKRRTTKRRATSDGGTQGRRDGNLDSIQTLLKFLPCHFSNVILVFPFSSCSSLLFAALSEKHRIFWSILQNIPTYMACFSLKNLHRDLHYGHPIFLKCLWNFLHRKLHLHIPRYTILESSCLCFKLNLGFCSHENKYLLFE